MYTVSRFVHHRFAVRPLLKKVTQAQLGPLQLLRDVDVQWSSTDIMIERAISLCQVQCFFMLFVSVIK